MVTIELADETKDLISEQYGEEVLSAYEEGVPVSLFESISDGDSWEAYDNLGDLYDTVNPDAIADIVAENEFEDGVEEVEERLETLGNQVREFTAIKYALKEGLNDNVEL